MQDEQYTAEKLDSHDRQLVEHGRRIGQQEQLAADIAAAVWGNPSRGVRGIEQRVQDIEMTLRLIRFYGPIMLALLAVIAIGQWPQLMTLIAIAF